MTPQQKKLTCRNRAEDDRSDVPEIAAWDNRAKHHVLADTSAKKVYSRL
jgi:hypothetical protein